MIHDGEKKANMLPRLLATHLLSVIIIIFNWSLSQSIFAVIVNVRAIFLMPSNFGGGLQCCPPSFVWPSAFHYMLTASI